METHKTYVENVRNKLLGNGTAEKIITCMNTMGHKWYTSLGAFETPSRRRIEETVDYLIERIIESDIFESTGERSSASMGGITVENFTAYTGHEWHLSYTPIDSYSF